MNQVLKVGRYIFKHKVLAFTSILFMLAYSVFTVAPAHYAKNVVDYLIEHIKTGEKIELYRFFAVGALLMLIFALRGMSFFLQNYLMGLLAQRTIRNLRDKLYSRVVFMPISYFDKHRSGDLISRFTVDFVTLNQAIVVGIVGPLRDVPTIIFLFIIMWDRSWMLTMATLILLPIVSKLISVFGKQSNKATSKRLNQFGELSAFLSETITGIRVVKAFIMENYEVKRFTEANRRLYKHFMESVFISSYSVPFLEVTAAFFAVFVITYGGHLINIGKITFGDFMSFIYAFGLLNPPLRQLNGISLKIHEGIASATRVFEVLESDERIEEREDAIEIAPIKKEIRVKINRFSYEDTEVLKDIDLILKAGTITALVGSSGSGKSTLANLIPRFYDLSEEDGIITIDGVDIRNATLHSLRNQMATVTQEVVLFDDTIRNNISYGNVDCSEEVLINAAKAGYAHDFIMKLPNQYDQKIGEKGVMLSGGQRQRIAISRALIKNAPILILDEATSALDTESEKEVQAAIENLMKNRTSLVIAHRLSTIQHADIIHVMKDGQIIESGSHRELLTRNGEYKRLYDLQFNDTN